MLKYWIVTTTVFVIQVVMFASALYGAGDFASAIFLAGAAALVWGAIISVAFSTVLASSALAAGVLTLFLLTITINLTAAFTFVLFGAIGIGFLAMDVEEEYSSSWLWFIILLPFGIGTMIGGPILLWQSVKKPTTS